MTLDEDNPCPHCGNIETLTDRTDDEIKPIIPEELQYDFEKEEADDLNVYTPPTPQEIYGIETSLPKPQEALTGPPKSQEALIRPPKSQEALTGPPKSQEALIGPPKSQEALIGPPKPQEAMKGPPKEAFIAPPELRETVTSLPEPQETETGLPLPPKVATKRMFQDIPLEQIIPTIEDVSLDPASQKVYFQLSIEFQIILNNAPNYREGLSRWKLLLPDRLQDYGLTVEAWENIAQLGDSDEKIQKQLTNLINVIFGQ